MNTDRRTQGRTRRKAKPCFLANPNGLVPVAANISREAIDAYDPRAKYSRKASSGKWT